MMIIIRFAIPLIYSLLVGIMFGTIFKKRIIDSIAPAYFMQVLVMLLTGMIIGSVSGGILVFAVILIIAAFYTLKDKERRAFLLNQINIRNYDSGLLLFIVCYLFIYIINYGSHFSTWDEFSHWGPFIKETLRLDALYCVSPLEIAHKDYVPVITIFEALWCKLSLRYSEADAYRGVQMLQMAMILPIVLRKNDKVNNAVKIVRSFFRLFIVIVIPLYLTCQELFFYHTVYQDYIFGLIIFYCIYVVVDGVCEDANYHCFIVSLGLSVLVMSKMVAMAYLPLIWGFYLAVSLLNSKADFNIKKFICCLLCVGCIPVVIWISFNKFVDQYITNIGSGQSYDGLGIGKIIGIILHDGTVSYQMDVEKLYIDSLLNIPIIGQFGYVTISLMLVIGLMVFAFSRKDKIHRNKVLVICLFNLFSLVIYALMMYILYLTSFTEYEASYLASFTRYMSTPVLSTFYTTIYCLFEYAEWTPSWNVLVVPIWVAVVMVFGTCQEFDQLIPGVVLGEQARYESESEYVLKNVSDDESVYIINRGDNGFFATVMNYSCSPIVFSWSSPGVATSANDYYSVEYSNEGLYSDISAYDYIYFVNVDEDFITRYSSLFEDADKVVTGKLYKITGNGTKFELIDCSDL